jgi:hypothetical protein
VAHAQGYSGPLSLAQIADLPRSGLERDANAKQFAHLLRLEPEEWRAMCYRHINGRTRFDQRLFYGERITADDLNYRFPRICPRCLGEHPVWWAVWDLGLVTTCPIHRCHLLNQCPTCKRMLAWQRPAVHECRCGLDLRTVPPVAATADLIAINALIYGAAGLSPGAAAELDLAECGFPPEMLELKLGALLRLILFMGAIREKDGLRRKQRPFAATDLVAATEISRAAVALLREWPAPLREILRHMLPLESTHPAELNFSEIFGNFYRHLFRVLSRSEFGFLHDAFERFVIEDWKGLIRGQHRYFSVAVRRNSPWVGATEAERIARIGGGKILDLVHDGHLEALIVAVRPGGSRTECWIRRESLNRWIAARDAELARYMSRRFFFFLREDVMEIKQAFEKHAAPVMHYSKPDEFITLRHAIKNYLGRDSALAAVISAVVDGNLVPVGYATGRRGITGYLFRSEELRRYRPVPEVKASPDVFVNFREAATVLGVMGNVVRGLVGQGLLGVAAGYRNGFAKLVPEEEVRRFAESYVSTSVLAKQFRLNSGSLARHLKESGTPLLAIPNPDPRRGHAYFLRKDIAAQIRLPTRRMLREESQCRLKAARKQKWAEYRLTKERASGRPMRRVRTNCPDVARDRNDL